MARKPSSKPPKKTDVKTIDVDYGQVAALVAQQIVDSYKEEFEDMSDEYKDQAMAAVKDFAELHIKLAMADTEEDKDAIRRELAFVESQLSSYEAIASMRFMKSTCTIVGQVLAVVAIAAMKMV